jgi:hypothetical protein
VGGAEFVSWFQGQGLCCFLVVVLMRLQLLQLLLLLLMMMIMAMMMMMVMMSVMLPLLRSAQRLTRVTHADGVCVPVAASALQSAEPKCGLKKAHPLTALSKIVSWGLGRRKSFLVFEKLSELNICNKCTAIGLGKRTEFRFARLSDSLSHFVKR